MKWREATQKIGTVLLVSVFALCFAVAVWKLSGDHESRVWDREATLALVNEHLNPYVEDRVPEDLNIPS